MPGAEEAHCDILAGCSSLLCLEAVDPLQIGKSHPQAAFGLRVFDAEQDDDLVAVACDRDLAADVFVPLVAAVGKDQQHRPAGVDGLDNVVVERPTRRHIARSDPAGDTPPLQFVDDFERGRSILTDMANEQEEIQVGHLPGLC